ncbi:MAG: D-tyrosyl-tRNA(Tyr) deacylase [Gemmataceae bacterium]|nr:D-tyrosyl-tRNA(Tyr) deacylase [Gemmataceae bacterium]
MRAVLQRVSRASVSVGDKVVGAVDAGWLVLLGVAPADTPADAGRLADKVAGLRAFADADGKMNLSVQDIGGGVLVVSQFTLLGDCRKGRRPSFTGAAPPAVAEPLYERVVTALRALGVPTSTGAFGADMRIELVNDGPVTFVIETGAGE